LVADFQADAQAAYDAREAQLGEETMRELERQVLLTVLDRKWREHLYEMDYLREGIGLRAMAQRDPLVEYQREGFLLFQAMTEAIKEESVGYLFNLEVQVQQPEAEVGAPDAPGGVLVAKGLVTPQRSAALQYSAPSVDGDAGVEVRGESLEHEEGSGQTDGEQGANRAQRRASKRRRR
jgi:preprotein translocase subunit SecA